MQVTRSCKMQVMPQNRKLLGTVKVAEAVETACSRLLYFSFFICTQFASNSCLSREGRENGKNNVNRDLH